MTRMNKNESEFVQDIILLIIADVVVTLLMAGFGLLFMTKEGRQQLWQRIKDHAPIYVVVALILGFVLYTIVAR
jgi:sterol desaturase/sphingolipid hydroxylase (fatty acid hydroxylase superfamily)